MSTARRRSSIDVKWMLMDDGGAVLYSIPRTHGGVRKRVKEKPRLARGFRSVRVSGRGPPLTESSSWIIWTRLSNTGARFLTETEGNCVRKAVREHERRSC